MKIRLPYNLGLKHLSLFPIQPRSTIFRWASTGGQFPVEPLCSIRARQAIQRLPSYLADARSIQKYSSENPDGALQLSVAESLMLEDLLTPLLNAPTTIPSDAIYYQPTHGRLDFRATMLTYIEELLHLPTGRLKLEGLVVGAGCNAVLENLCFALAEPGDAVMIPTPYYAAFEFDLAARAGLKIEPVTTMSYHSTSQKEDGYIYYPTTAALDAAFERAKQAGNVPRILLLSNPHNPLGICYPQAVIEECIAWCRENKVHLISDEIYAGSVYRYNSNFRSVLDLASRGEGLGPYIHCVYSLSKDFALSGLRIGVSYTENSDIILPLQKLNDLCQISSSTQLWMKSILDRKDADGVSFATCFQRENHRRLIERCQRLTGALDEIRIPYLPPSSGLFVWIDLSSFLSTDPTLSADEAERLLYLQLIEKAGLLLTPGRSMKNELPGFFRLVFTAVRDEEFSLCLDRLRRLPSIFGTNQ